MKALGSRPGFGLFVSLGCLVTCHFAQAGSATWNLNPVDNNWNNPANWTPQTVPNGPTDVATFAESSKTDLKFSAAATEVAEIVFEPGASSFTITAKAETAHTGVTLTISGAGITNNSGVTQTLNAGPTVVFDVGIINFTNSATAGDRTALNALASDDEGSFPFSLINFYDTSSAGHASIYAEGARGTLESYGAEVNFYDQATAGDASCIVTGSFGCCYAGKINFRDDSSAGNARFRVLGAEGCCFGGAVTFFDNSTGGTAQLTILNGGGASIIGTVGSIAGTGVFGYGNGKTLSVGANNLSSIFRGTITGDGSGSLIKIGSGTLTLKGASYYLGATLVTEGTLLAANPTGSATGTGVVKVEGGTLGGGGTISGAVMVGTGSGSGSVLDPAASTSHIVTLETKSNLTMQSDATYRCTIDFEKSKATSVITTGVTLSNGPTIVLTKIRNGTLAQGTVFKIISNTGTFPISGTFSNLADGAIVNVGGTNFQADYQGGDGNDLTLTVQ